MEDADITGARMVEGLMDAGITGAEGIEVLVCSLILWLVSVLCIPLERRLTTSDTGMRTLETLGVSLSILSVAVLWIG